MAFPPTRHSVIVDLAHSDSGHRERALEVVARAYRGPLVAVVRHRWELSTDDAEDLVQEFFAQAIDKGWLGRYDATRGRFRTFLRSCMWSFASTVYESSTRQKRGGGIAHVTFDALMTPPAVAPEVDAVFEREWVRSVLELSLEALRQECLATGRASTWQVFHAREVEGTLASDTPTSYRELATRFSIAETQVTNFLNWGRRRFRAHVLETIRSLTGSDEECREETRLLLGVDP